MARFSQAFLQGLLQPSYQQGLFEAARGVGQTPGIMRMEQQRVERQAEIKKLLQENMNNPAKLQQLAQQYLAQGNEDAAAAFKNAATAATTMADQRRMAVRQGVLGAAYQAGVEGKPIDMLQPELATFTSSQVGGQASNFIEIYEKGVAQSKGKDSKFGTTVTEWVNPSDPDKVLLKTVQPEGSAFPVKLGSNTRVSSAELEGLVKRQGKPAVSVTVGDKAADAYAKKLAEGVADQDLKILENGRVAENNLGSISEAKLVLAEPGNDILGFGAENITEAKSAVLSLMGALGVSENDSLYQKLSQETAAANLYNMFTQEFVKVRMEATKGAITEREFSTFIASVPNLLQTAEGYKRVLTTMERANTAAVLKAKHVENNMGTQQSAKNARDQWSSFSNKFPLGSLSSEAMSTVFEEFIQPDFNMQNLMFSYIDKDSKERVQATYGEIARAARTNGIHPVVALKRLFDKRSAQHVQL